MLSPAEVLMKVNRLLAADMSQGQYVTALYVVIDTVAGAAKVASAGHLPLVVYRHAIGKTAVVNPQGVALGLDVGPLFDREITEDREYSERAEREWRERQSSTRVSGSAATPAR